MGVFGNLEEISYFKNVGLEIVAALRCTKAPSAHNSRASASGVCSWHPTLGVFHPFLSQTKSWCEHESCRYRS